jgi:hypothetical protein
MKNFLLFISLVVFFTQILFSQKQSVHLITSNKEVLAGEIVTLTVKSSIGGTVNIDFPDQFELGSGVMNGMEQETDYNTGTVRALYYFSQNGIFKKEGTYTFKAYVKNKNQVFKSNSITIQVKKQTQDAEEIKSKQIKELAFGVIEKSKNKLYEGEALVLSAKVYYRPELEIHNQFQYQTFELEKKSEVHEIENTKSVYTTRENYKGQAFQTFTYGKQVVFPLSIGKQTVVPFEMILQYNDGGLFLENIPFRSSKTSFEVLPLPEGAPLSFCGGVGEFTLESSINEKNLVAGDVCIYTLTIAGEGNLQNLEAPKIKLPDGLEIYGDIEREEDFAVSLNGLKGKIRFVYRLKCTKNGVQKVPSASISYFKPSEKKYITCTAKSQSLVISGNYNLQVASGTSSNRKKSEENRIVKGENRERNDPTNSATPLILIGILSPLALGFLFLFVLRKKTTKKDENLTCSSYDSITKLKEIKAHFKILKDAFYAMDNQTRIKELTGILRTMLLYNLKLEASELATRELLSTCKDSGIDVVVFEQVKNECEEANYSFDCENLTQGAYHKLERLIDAL